MMRRKTVIIRMIKLVRQIEFLVKEGESNKLPICWEGIDVKNDVMFL